MVNSYDVGTMHDLVMAICLFEIKVGPCNPLSQVLMEFLTGRKFVFTSIQHTLASTQHSVFVITGLVHSYHIVEIGTGHN